MKIDKQNKYSPQDGKRLNSWTKEELQLQVMDVLELLFKGLIVQSELIDREGKEFIGFQIFDNEYVTQLSFEIGWRVIGHVQTYEVQAFISSIVKLIEQYRKEHKQRKPYCTIRVGKA